MLSFSSFLLLFVIGFELLTELQAQPIGKQPRLQKLPEDYWFIPELSEVDKAEFKAWVDRLTEDVLNGKNDTKAKEVCGLKFGTEMCTLMSLALILA